MHSSFSSLRTSVVLRLFAFAAITCIPAASNSTTITPQTDPEPQYAPVLSSIQDEQLAREFISIARKQLTFIDDPLLNHYVESLTETLAGNAGFDSSHFRVFVVEDKTVNAIAGPGGTFMFYTGLFQVAETEGEFASVVAHEIAHHSQKHIRQMIAKQNASVVPSMLGVLAGILIGGSEGVATSAGSLAAQRDMLIRYTLTLEREADAIGLRILAASDYDPRHARNFMSSLQRWIRLRGERQSALHNTHPLTPERIANIENRLLSYGGKSYSADSFDFYLAKARAQALYAYESNEAVAKLQALLANDPNNAPLRYGYAIALGEVDDHDTARQYMKPLIESDPQNPWYLLAIAQIELESGNADTAVALLEANKVDGPYHSAWLQVYGDYLIDNGRADEAKRLIRKQIIRDPDNHTLYSMHARASAHSGDNLKSHLSMAEHYYLLGALEAALQQITLAQQLAQGDFYATEKIKERKKAIQSEMAWTQ